MPKKTLTMLAVGDIILARSQAVEPLFDLVAPVLRSGDVVVGQGEILYTSRGVDTFANILMRFMVKYKASPPKNMKAYQYAGFNVVTLANNTCWDLGDPGIEDTITGLRNLGIATAGAGMNIDEARRPAVIERDGTRIGFLAYNCVGPQASWAMPDKAGCAYVHSITAYEVKVPIVGIYPVIYTFAEPRSLKAMVEDIQKLRPLCDVLVVSLHKGIGHIPAILAMYEQQVSYAAIDAGADLILGHHAHILKGIELYKGKAIFHGLGNFVAAMRDGPEKDKSPQEQQENLKELKKRHGGPFFFERGGKESPFPPPEENMTIIAKCTVDGGGISGVSYLPCLINEQKQPEILKNDKRGQQVFDYVENITRAVDLNTQYEWKGNEVAIHS